MSINDKIGVVNSTFRGKIVFMSFLMKLLKQFMSKGSNDDKKGEKKESGQKNAAPDMKSMMNMLNGFTILRLSNMAGAVGVTVTKEMLLDVNKKLNKIKKRKQ